ncbi:MAG TPA: hypothetical protein VHU83_25240 [Bryobacteraceae bacterium]|jgi:hypothetical protein|nr:hypothetical protein [Bryobacteraceae bacterium]
MQPSQLKADQFSAYPPQARQIAEKRIALFESLPLAFLPLLLRELIAYDWKFPAERRELDSQLAYLGGLSARQLADAMAPFGALHLSAELEHLDWVAAPAQFSEQLTAHLWATHQIDAFRSAAIDYVHKVNGSVSMPALPIPRLGMVVIGAGVDQNRHPLFRKLRPQGVYFNNVDPKNGWSLLTDTLTARAAAHPVPFGHWYIDGAVNRTSSGGLTCISYDALQGVRTALVNKMRAVMQPGGGGPEVLRTLLAQMRPEDLGLDGAGEQGVLTRFQVSILTEGSGTQLFSTTFVQWSAREALRRAQPVTLLARFAPRQREQSMKELLAGVQQRAVPDPEGSLIDADMGAYYTWINQQRLSGAEQSSFLVWFEDHNEALAISPALARGKADGTAIDMRELMRRLTV